MENFGTENKWYVVGKEEEPPTPMEVNIKCPTERKELDELTMRRSPIFNLSGPVTET